MTTPFGGYKLSGFGGHDKSRPRPRPVHRDARRSGSSSGRPAEVRGRPPSGDNRHSSMGERAGTLGAVGAPRCRLETSMSLLISTGHLASDLPRGQGRHRHRGRAQHRARGEPRPALAGSSGGHRRDRPGGRGCGRVGAGGRVGRGPRPGRADRRGRRGLGRPPAGDRPRHVRRGGRRSSTTPRRPPLATRRGRRRSPTGIAATPSTCAVRPCSPGPASPG